MPFYCNDEGKTNKVFIHRISTGETTLFGCFAVTEKANQTAHDLFYGDDDIDQVIVKQASGWIITMESVA